LGGYAVDSGDFTVINLPNTTHIIKLLQRIRDESHRFAVSYHTVLKRTKQTTSVLEEIPGVGPKTRSKLIRKFGSVKGIKNASRDQIAVVVGFYKADKIINSLLAA